MKLLLIHTNEEKDTASRLESLFAEIDISFEAFFLNSPGEMDISRFTAFFDFSSSEENEQEHINAATHVLVISSLCSQWFDFLAGFTFGSRVPMLVYGQEAITGISKEFAAFFTFIGTEASLQTYLKVESEVSKKQEAARNIIKAQESLLKIGIPITIESLAQCIMENRVKEISFFFAAGFSVNSRNNVGVPMLNIAARNGSHDAVDYLLTAGADVHLLAEDRGTTALIDSIMAQYEDIAADLIKAGTDLDVKDKDGQTALIIAAGASREKMVELLLKAGADPDIPDSLGASARKYATLFHNEPILALFNTIAPVKDT
jgi:hypothetical protein